MGSTLKANGARALVLAAAVLYVACSFLRWQHFKVTIAITVRYGFSEWHGVGAIAASIAVALLGWEAARLLGLRLPGSAVSPAFVSFALPLFLFVFTLLAFESRSAGRQWPAWAGLVLSAVALVAAIVRARAEGVELLRLTRPQDAERVSER